jgi:hypothetical protein
MIHESRAAGGSRLVGLASAVVLLLLTGCASSPGSMPPPPPELELVAAGVLELPLGCEPAAGAVYRTNYLVSQDGRVAQAVPESGPGCVQDAMRRWVESFQYLPPAGPVAATIDWMAVTGARGSG